MRSLIGWRATPDFAYVSNGAQERMEADGQFLLRNRYLLEPGRYAGALYGGRVARRAAGRSGLAGVAHGLACQPPAARGPHGRVPAPARAVSTRRRPAEARRRLVQRRRHAGPADRADPRGGVRYRCAGARAGAPAQPIRARCRRNRAPRGAADCRRPRRLRRRRRVRPSSRTYRGSRCSRCCWCPACCWSCTALRACCS